jgi:hypothetical protein
MSTHLFRVPDKHFRKDFYICSILNQGVIPMYFVLSNSVTQHLYAARATQ